MTGAVSFLTVFGRARPPGRSDLVWFPFVGALVGALTGLVWWGASQWWPPAVAAVAAVAADLALTGLLHVDGLADSADGLLPHLERSRRLAVMAAPDVGAFAVATVGIVLLARVAGFASLGLTGSRTVAATAGLWALSRGVMATAVLTMTYARDEGLASAFGPAGNGPDGPRVTRVMAGVLAVATLASAVVLVGTARGYAPGTVAVLVAASSAVAVLALGQRRLGGYTGDVLGAAGVVAETVGLLAIAARP